MLKKLGIDVRRAGPVSASSDTQRAVYSWSERETLQSEAACGCLVSNALIVVSLYAAGLSSKENILNAAFHVLL